MIDLFITLVVLLTGLLPTYLIRFSLFGLPTNALEVGILLTGVIGLATPSIRRLWVERWRTLPQLLTWLLAGLLVASIVSVIISPQLHVSLGILKGWIGFPVLLGWFVYCLADRSDVRDKIIKALILSGIVVALLGISQLGTLERVKSIYDVPNSLALYLVPIFMLAYGRRQWWQAGVMGAAILATQSVGAIGAIALTLPLLTKERAGVRLSRQWVVIGICLALTLTYLTLTGRLAYLAAPLRNPAVHNSISVRLQLWSVSWQLIRQHPLLGIGLGQFEPAYQATLVTRQGAISEFVLRDPHNWILSFWLNTGLLGFLSFAGLNAWALWHTFRTPSNSPSLEGENIELLPSSEGRLGGVFATALIAMLLFGLVDTIYWKNDLAALWWILIALLAAN